jgi:hypothetical protein
MWSELARPAQGDSPEDKESQGVRRLRNIEMARIECDGPTPAQVDGEFVGELETIELGLIRDGATFLV